MAIIPQYLGLAETLEITFNNDVLLADYHIAIILLAAGRGTRMEAHNASMLPKLLLPMSDGQPIVRHAAQAALALRPEELIVVVRPDLPAIESALSGLAVKCRSNPGYMEGMGSSLALGVRGLEPTVEAVLVMLGDEPAIPQEIVHGVVDAYLQAQMPITAPIYGSGFGPPTLFSRSLFAELSTLRGDTGGRQLIARYPELVCRVPFPENARPHDIDTPEDYSSILRGS